MADFLPIRGEHLNFDCNRLRSNACRQGRGSHQQHGDVVDIGAGRSGEDQLAAGFQGVISVVVRQRFADGDAQRLQRIRRGAVGDAAGRWRFRDGKWPVVKC